jgi:uncharacterized protein YjdB
MTSRSFRLGRTWRLAFVAATLLGCGGDATGPNPVASVEISGAPIVPTLVGSTLQLAVVTRDANGVILPDRPATWSSSDTLVARVGTTGLVSSVGAGMATITASSESRSTSVALDFRVGGAVGPDGGSFAVLGGSFALTVPAGALTQTSILTVLASAAAPPDVRLVDSRAYQLGPQELALSRPATVTLRYDRARLPQGLSEAALVLGVLTGGVWAPVPGSTAAVSSGTVSGVITRAGTYAVLAAEVDHVTITGAPASGQLFVGQSAQLVATPYDVANNPLAGRPISWSTSDAAKLSVSPFGRATALAVGGATITATIGGKSATVAMDTRLVPVASIVVLPGSAALYTTGTLKLAATAKDSAGGTLADRALTWSSSDETRATVDASGTVTAVGAGIVSITATSDQVSGTTSITVLPAAVADWSLAVADWTTFQGNASHTGYVPAVVDPLRFRTMWSTTVFAGVALNPVTAGDGNVFVSSNAYFGKQQLSVVDAATGTPRWTYDFGAIHSVDPPAYGNGTVYVQTGGHGDSFLWAFDPNAGSIRFRAAYENQWSRYYAPVVVDQSVYVAGGSSGGMYAFGSTDGAQRWFATLNQYDQFTPAVKDGLVYAYTGVYAPKLTVTSAATGAVSYEIADPGFAWNGYSMDGSPVLGGANNVLSTQANRLVSFDLTAKTIAWTKTGTFVGNVTTAGDGHLYVFNNRQLEVHRESDGAAEWIWIPSEGSPIGTTVLTKNLIFVSTAANTYAIDLGSHRQVWSYPAGGHLALSNQGLLLIAQSNGKLTAIGVR